MCVSDTISDSYSYDNSVPDSVGDSHSDTDIISDSDTDADSDKQCNSDDDSERHVISESDTHCDPDVDTDADSDTVGDPEHIAVSPSVPCSGHVDVRGRIGGRVEWRWDKRVWVSREHPGRICSVWSDSCCVEDGERHPKPLSDPRGAGGGGAGLVGVVGLVHCCGRGRDFRSV